MIISKNSQNWIEIKFEIENVDFVRRLICAQKIECSGWVGGWMDGWMDGWMGGSKSRVKDCLQQSKIEYLILN